MPSYIPINTLSIAIVQCRILESKTLSTEEKEAHECAEKTIKTLISFLNNENPCCNTETISFAKLQEQYPLLKAELNQKLALLPKNETTDFLVDLARIIDCVYDIWESIFLLPGTNQSLSFIQTNSESTSSEVLITSQP
jgi:hypothetical protein